MLYAVSGILAIFLLTAGCGHPEAPEITETLPVETTVPPTTVVMEPPHNWVTGYISTVNLTAD